MALCVLGLAWLDALAADLSCELLGRNLAIAVHQHDERLRVLILHDERLNHLALGHAERLRGYGGAAALHILVLMLAVADAVGVQHLRRRCLHPRGWCLACSCLSRSRAT